jgi:flavodoxin
MKKLVIYYSLTGNTKFIAEIIVRTIKADLLEVKPKKDLKKNGGMKYFWGGMQVVMKSKPKLLPLEKNPNEYDIIFIGTPVWSWSFTPAMRSFFSEVELKGKKIAVFASHSGGLGSSLEKMEAELKNNKIIGKKDFLEPLTGKVGKRSTEDEIIEWTKKVMKDT